LQDKDILKAKLLCQEGILLAENQNKLKTKTELLSLLEQLNDSDWTITLKMCFAKIFINKL